MWKTLLTLEHVTSIMDIVRFTQCSGKRNGGFFPPHSSPDPTSGSQSLGGFENSGWACGRCRPVDLGSSSLLWLFFDLLVQWLGLPSKIHWQNTDLHQCVWMGNTLHNKFTLPCLTHWDSLLACQADCENMNPITSLVVQHQWRRAPLTAASGELHRLLCLNHGQIIRLNHFLHVLGSINKDLKKAVYKAGVIVTPAGRSMGCLQTRFMAAGQRPSCLTWHFVQGMFTRSTRP